MPEISYSKRIVIINIIKIVLLVFILLLLFAWATKTSVNDFITNKRWADAQFIGTGAGLFIFFLLGMFYLKLLQTGAAWLDKILLIIDNARKGDWGERKTFERLRELLGSQYRIYRNLKIPDQKFDIDAVVLGPKGIITFEIKNLGIPTDHYRFEGEDAYKISRYKNGNECSCKMGPYGNANPIKEAMRHNQALEEWLMKSGLGSIKVKGAVLMTGKAKIEDIKNPAVFIVNGLDQIKRFIDGAYEDPEFTEEFCAKLDKLFTK